MNNQKNYTRIISIIIFILILTLGAVLRFYKIDQYLTFLGDEGRDVLVVKRMIVDHKLTLLGPTTSVGSMYMGPVYYYMMAPFLLLWNLDPTGTAVMVALFSVMTMVLLYKTGREFFNPMVGYISSYLYAISPLTIIYGKSSWNPNVVPFFSLLIIYALLKVVVKRETGWLIVALFALGINIQLHYVTLLMIPVIVMSLLFMKFRIPFKNFLLSIGAFIIAYSPFLLFEIRHGFVNTNAVIHFVFSQKGSGESGVTEFMKTVMDVFVRIFWRLTILESAELTKLFLIITIFTIAFWIIRNKNSTKLPALKIILLWISGAILSFGFYRGIIYDYYFGTVFAAPFLITAFLVSILWKLNKLGKAATIILILFLSYASFNKSPFRIAPNNMLKNTKEISQFIYDKTNGKPYNFALITGQNSDHAYRYFLEVWGHPPLTIENPVIDPDRKSVTSQLLVICEEKKCQPLGHPLWEIAGFGRAEIVGEWPVSTIKVYRLIHYTNSDVTNQ